MAFCTVARNRKGNIMAVYAPNRQLSLLYDTINNRLNDPELSLKIWASAYTKQFMKRTNNWADLQLDRNGEPIIQFNGDNYDFIRRNEETITRTQDNYKETLDRLAKKFNIPWVVDNDQSSISRIENNTVYVNLKLIQPDTPFHEYGHIFEQVIKKENKRLWDNLARKVDSVRYEGRRISDFVGARYPGLNSEDLVSESIVTAIGLYATDPKGLSEEKSFTNLIPTIFKWVKDYIKSLYTNPDKKIEAADLNENTSFKTISDLMRLQNPVQTKGLEFTAAAQVASMVGQNSRLDTIYQQNQGAMLNDSDPKNTFYQRGGDIFKRLTEWVSENFTSEARKKAFGTKSPAEWLADKYYRKRGINTSDAIVWDQTAKEVSYDELVQIYQKQLDKTRNDGNIAHSFIEYFINKDEAVRERIEDLLEKGNYEGWEWKWMNNNYIQDLLHEELKLNIGERYKQSPLMDKIGSEVTVVSDLLGIGTKIDLLVEHSNGNMSIIDFKTGAGFLSDSSTFDSMPYGDLLDARIRDSKLDKAQMELMLRALILKEKNPDLKFRDLEIAHLIAHRRPRIYKVSMKNYLQVLNDFFKDTDPGLHMKLQMAGLLKFENYTAESKQLSEMYETNDTFKNMPKPEQITVLLNQLQALELRYKETDEEDVPVDVRRKMRDLSMQVLELQKENSTDFQADAKDMGWLERWFGNLYEVANPILQTFVRLAQKAKFGAVSQFNAVREEQRRLLKPVLEEYYQKFPLKKLGNKAFGASIKYHTDDNQGLFDFMWERKTVSDVDGYFARLITPEDVKNGTFTQAQYEYNSWYRKTLEELWKGTMREKVGKRTKEDIWHGQFPWNANFMPRVPISQEEIAEREGYLSKDYLKGAFINFNDFFIKEQYRDGSNNLVGMPVKYTGSQSIISSVSHSMNAEEAMLLFAQNMINKKNLDPIDALGKGTMSLLKAQKDPTTNKTRFKRSISWLEDFIKRQVTYQQEDLTLSREGVKLPFSDKAINATRFMDSINNYVSAATMWVSIRGGVFNTVMISLYNLKEGIKGSIMKSLGASDQDVDYSLSDFAFGIQQWLKEGVLPNLKERTVDPYKDAVMKSKLHRFVELMNFDTNSFTFSVDKSDLMSAKNTLLDKGHLYLAHSIGEEFGLFTQMVAQLQRKKIKNAEGNWIKIGEDGSSNVVDSPSQASSMWDAYEVTPEGAFVYKGPLRGVLTDGTEIRGLTTDEINKMRRFSQRVNGAYREDEKAAIEMWAAGRWLMKFKKYLPAIVANNFQSKFNDWSIGDYEEVGKDDQGRSVFEWTTKVNEGRFNLFCKFMWFSIAYRFSDSESLKPYAWDNLSPEQQKLILDAGISVMMYFSLLTAGMFYWDDDEDKNLKTYRSYQRLTEDTIQIHPLDMLRHLSNPLLQGQQLYKTAEAFSKFMFNGLVMGERIETGPNAGNLPGQTYLQSKTPIINIANQFGILDDEDDPEVSLFNRR